MVSGIEAAPSGASLEEESANAVFLSWERLRLVYNVPLAAIVLAFSGSDLANGAFLKFLALAAIGANLCFCAGPVLEGYLALLGVDRRTARWILFVIGLLFACLLTVVSLLAWRMPRFP